MLVWNTYIGDFNSHRIEIWNVFNHTRLIEDLGKELRRLKRNKDLTEEQKREAFLEKLKSGLMYCYWSKCEWEVIISHWPQSENFLDEKIDVYDQVLMNWDVFSDYAWNHRKEILQKADQLKKGRKGL